jgi:hypothetical protein
VSVAWDIPVTEGYEFELVPNVSPDQGTHRFSGLNNPPLVEGVTAWKPDAVHITSWAWLSHLLAMRAFHKQGIPVLFRGDSHLARRSQTRAALVHEACRAAACIFSWSTAFLVVAKPSEWNPIAFTPVPIPSMFIASSSWRMHWIKKRLNGVGNWAWTLIGSMLLFAGKFDKNKRSIELMRTVHTSLDRRLYWSWSAAGSLMRR